MNAGGSAQGLTESDRLLEAARAGNAQTLWRLAEDLRPYLKLVAARELAGRLRDKVEDSDIVQDALLAAVQQFSRFRGQTAGEMQAWLVVIVRHHTRNLLRYHHQQVRDAQRECSLDAVGASLAANGAGPCEQAARREQAIRLLAAVDRLPEEYRQVILLRQFMGLAHAEVAARMGRTEESVRQLWVRALRLLRRELGEHP